MMKQIFSTILVILAVTFVAIQITSCQNDRCKQRGVVCLNEGTCFNGDCVCPTGWIGKLCDTTEYYPFLGYYGGTLLTAPNSRKDFDTIYVTPGNSNTTINFRSVVVTEVRDTFNIPARIKGDRIYIENTVSASGFTYNGSGNVNRDIITLAFYKDSIGQNGLKYKSDTMSFVGDRVVR
jgi:hypothetical protein